MSDKGMMNSPLTTKEQRDKLVRRPVRQSLLLMDPPLVDLSSKRILRSSMGSPKQSSQGNFATSSPMDQSSGKDDTPGVSMIASQNSGGKGGRKSTSRINYEQRSKSRNESSIMESSDDDDEDDDDEYNSDDPQPSAKVSNRSHQERGTVMTPMMSKEGIRKRMSTSARTLDYSDRSSLDADKSFVDFSGAGVFCFFLAFFLAAFVVAGVVLGLAYGEQNNMLFVHRQGTDVNLWTEADANASITRFRQEVASLQRAWPGQDKRTWTVIRAGIKSVLNTTPPTQPAVLLLAHDSKAQPSAKCLSKKIASIASSLFDTTNEVTFRSGSSLKDRNALHNALDGDLAATSTFYLSDLPSLSGKSAMALHAFCDNINAPHKRAVVVLLTEVGEQAENVDEAAEKALYQAWSKDLDADKLSPLLSRITVSLVRIKQENNLPSDC